MKYKISIIGIILTLVISAILYVFFNTGNNQSQQKNYETQEAIRWSPGWQQSTDIQGNKVHRSIYGGSSFNFEFSGNPEIIFDISSPFQEKRAIIEIKIDDLVYRFDNNELVQAIALSGKDINDTHTVYGRMYCTGHEYNQCDIRINEIILADNAKLMANENNESKKLLTIVGDSISVIYGADNYTYNVADKLDHDVLNASIAGLTLHEIVGAHSGISIAQEIVSLHMPETAIIALGTNDISEDFTPEEFHIDYQKLLDSLIALNPDITIFALGLFWRHDISEQTLQQYSSSIEQSTKAHDSVYYIDPYYWLSPDDFKDGLHPKKESQETIAKQLIEEIESQNYRQ